MNTLSKCIQYDGGCMDEKILAYRSELCREQKEKTSREPCFGQANRKGLTELINSDGLTAIIRGFAYMPRRLMNCATRKNKLKKIRAMALKPKPDIRRSMRSMSFGRN